LKSHIVVPPHNFEPVTLALSIVGNYDAPVWHNLYTKLNENLISHSQLMYGRLCS
jgi:hypothetical protein